MLELEKWRLVKSLEKLLFHILFNVGILLSYLVFVLQSIQKEQRSNGGFACYTFKLTVEATAKLSCLTGRAISTIC